MTPIDDWKRRLGALPPEERQELARFLLGSLEAGANEVGGPRSPMPPGGPRRRRLTIGFLMAAIALSGIPIYLAIPVVRVGGVPHHMTAAQVARWLTIDREGACARCHGGVTRRTAFEIPAGEIRRLASLGR